MYLPASLGPVSVSQSRPGRDGPILKSRDEWWRFTIPRRSVPPRVPLRRARIGARSAGRNRLFASIIIEAAPGLAAEPARLDIFHEERTGPILAVGKALVEDVHDGETGVEADEIGELERPHRMMGAKPHADVDRLDRADTFIKCIDRFVDHGQQDAVHDEGRKILGVGRGLAEL